jgi:tetratricopeptide (TPR) repeat protein
MQQIVQQATTLLANGNSIKAEELLRELLTKQPKNEELLILLAHSLFRQQKVADAINVFEEVVSIYPLSVNAVLELASAYLSVKNYTAAEHNFKKVVEVEPSCTEGWQYLGNLLMQRGENKEATHCFIQAERNDPFRKHFIKIQSALKDNNLRQAEAICREVLNHESRHPQALHTLAKLAEHANAHEESYKILKHGLIYAPYHINLLTSLVKCCTFLGLLTESITTARRIVVIEPQQAKYCMLLAEELANTGQNKESLKYYNKAVTLSPEVANVYIQRGHIHKTMGKRDACEADYRKSLELEKKNGTAFWALADLKSHRFSNDDIKLMENITTDKNVVIGQACQATFALAKYYEDENHFDIAFDYYQKANKLKPNIHFLPSEYKTQCETIKNGYTKETLLTVAKDQTNQTTPIFIVGLTRSGSTLLEQMLASHSAIEGTMELYSLPRVVRRLEVMKGKEGKPYPENLDLLSGEELASIGQSYLKETAIYRTDKPYFVDKMPANFHNVGLIHKILPHAIIIDARRHPLSTGFSNYKQHFARGYDFSYDLNHIGHYYNHYVALMDYWDDVLPGKVLCMQYEEMVQDTENQVRKLLAHCKLPFEAECLEFYKNKRAVRTASSEQVRQPINTKGMQQWKKFEKHLFPLKEALGEQTLSRFAKWL